MRGGPYMSDLGGHGVLLLVSFPLWNRKVALIKALSSLCSSFTFLASSFAFDFSCNAIMNSHVVQL